RVFQGAACRLGIAKLNGSLPGEERGRRQIRLDRLRGFGGGECGGGLIECQERTSAIQVRCGEGRVERDRPIEQRQRLMSSTESQRQGSGVVLDDRLPGGLACSLAGDVICGFELAACVERL